LLAELNRISKENQKLMVTIQLMSTNYHSLQTQLIKLQEDYKRSSLKSMAKTLKLGMEVEGDCINGGCTRQVMDYSVDSSSALSDNSENKSRDDLELDFPCKKGKVNHVVEQKCNGNESSSTNGVSLNKKIHVAVVPTPKKIINVVTKSEVTTVSDGCQWRKYGQKMTRNSRWPRAYYKCAVPLCAVKKQIQRCAADPTMLTAIYEGEHNHLLSPVAMAVMNTSSNAELPFPASIATISSMGSSPTITLDLTNNLNPNLQGYLLDPQGQLSMDSVAYANADPNYNTAVLAVAIAASLIKLGTPLQ
ncbi:hypothetical protein KI387_030922, partial [Taxus chinensis]